jgi:hypothetical protein
MDKRITALAMASQMGATICSLCNLEEAELYYAPRFDSAKDQIRL